MKITIIHACVGKDGEHLEQGSTVEYPEADALKLVRLGRAFEAAEDAVIRTGGGDAPSAEAAALFELTKDALLDIVAKEEVDVKASATKAAIVEAILLKRSAAA